VSNLDRLHIVQARIARRHWEDLMKLPRRTFFRLAAGAVAAPAVSGFARAQTDASRPVRIMVGFAPGSAADVIARLLGQSLSERLGRQVIIDNRPGAGGNVATEAVVNAPPDGCTLLMVGPSSAINATLYEKLNFDFLGDIVPVAAVVRSPNVMVLSPSVPAKTVPEFIALAKANPGELNMASAGVGTATHLVGEMFKMMTGVNMVHVAYRGGGAGAYADLLDGRVEVYFPPLASSIGYIRAGQLRALAVTTAPRRQRPLDIPTLGESVPGYEASTWFGVGAPRYTPAEIIDRLNTEINAALADPKVAARVADFGGTVSAGSPADFGRLVAEETAKWAKVIKLSGTTS
jgi:tripartite-type tricarboxylate transporter receptor subunit TctC